MQACTQGGFRSVQLNPPPPFKLMIFIVLANTSRHCMFVTSYTHSETCVLLGHKKSGGGG